MTPTSGLTAVTVAAVLVYIGLAVLGGGGFATFFANPARVALVVIVIVLAAASAFTRASMSPGEREDRGNRWVIPVIGVLGLLMGIVPAYTDRVGFWTIDGDFVRWLGVVLFAAGGALRLWPVFILGHRFSGLVAIQPGHTLVTQGIFRFIRHPSYLGLLTNSLGWVLVFRSGVGVLLALLMILPIIGRIHAEEALLSSQFGGEYDDYRSRTVRLIPGLW
jgi:protein-S-isoprenylcysteine O-methyltransferase Ste14